MHSSVLSIGVMLNDDGRCGYARRQRRPDLEHLGRNLGKPVLGPDRLHVQGGQLTSLEGKVTAFDVSTAITNFGSGTRWQDGSFDYQGAVSAFNVSTAINTLTVQSSGEYPYSTSFASLSASLGGGSVSRAGAIAFAAKRLLGRSA